MVRVALVVLLMLAASAGAYAQFNKCGRGFCPSGIFGSGFPAPAAGGGSGPPANALLSQTGVCILAQTGSCIMVQ